MIADLLGRLMHEGEMQSGVLAIVSLIYNILTILDLVAVTSYKAVPKTLAGDGSRYHALLHSFDTIRYNLGNH